MYIEVKHPSVTSNNLGEIVMRKKVWVFLAPGFEEIESITVVDILRRSGVEVVMVGTVDGPIEGSRGVRILADQSIDKMDEGACDMIVFPGGLEGTKNLKKDVRVKYLLEKAIESKKWIAAICAAPSLLVDYLIGKKATSHPSVQSMMSQVNYSEERVVIDDYFITSRAPGTAMEFAFELVRILAGEERVRVVNEGVMAEIHLEPNTVYN
jgi:4-methyl-5(b-hydroxyethyl)-thiazole monophosphate biosynthesis